MSLETEFGWRTLVRAQFEAYLNFYASPGECEVLSNCTYVFQEVSNISPDIPRNKDKTTAVTLDTVDILSIRWTIQNNAGQIVFQPANEMKKLQKLVFGFQ